MCMCVICVWTYVCLSTHVEVRGQLCRVVSLFPSLIFLLFNFHFMCIGVLSACMTLHTAPEEARTGHQVPGAGCYRQ